MLAESPRRYEIAPFVPLLLPALERAKEEISDPECRDVCAKAHEQLSRTANKPPVWNRIEAPKGARCGTVQDTSATCLGHVR